VSDGEDLSTPDLVRALAAGLGVEPRLIDVPRAVLLWAGTMIGRRAAIERLTASLQVDSRRIRSEFDWVPPYSTAQGLEATARWYRQGGDSAAV
jgi:nucleoside-diphosphate-sugar epimerase